MCQPALGFSFRTIFLDWLAVLHFRNALILLCQQRKAVVVSESFLTEFPYNGRCVFFRFPERWRK